MTAKPDILSAVDALAEHPNIKHGAVSLRLDSDQAVDELYAALGEPVKARPGDYERPYDDISGDLVERRASTTVQGVRVSLVGPARLMRGVA